MRKDKAAHRAYQLAWYHANKRPLSGEHKNQNSDKTHCIRGHEFTEENTVLKVQYGKKYRLCRKCRNADACRRGDELRRNLDTLDPVRKEKYHNRRRKAQLKTVGWTPAQFESKWIEQEEKCAVCKKKLSIDINANRNDKAQADHEHIYPPKPRGVLCVNCNLGIGNLQENVEIMEAAIAYVKHYKEG
jgi:hypothetical protein